MRLPVLSLLLVTLVGAPSYAASIAVPENVPPWGMSNDLPPGQQGIYADLAAALAARLKTLLDVKFVPYGRMLEGVRTGEFDYAFGVISPRTQAAAPFTVIVARVPMVAVARRGLSLKTVADLHKFTEVGYLRGGSCGAVIDNDSAIRRIGQDSYLSGIQKLAAGRLDGWCSIKAGFAYALSHTESANDLGEQLDYGEAQIGLQVTPSHLNTPEAKRAVEIVHELVAEKIASGIFVKYVGTAYAP